MNIFKKIKKPEKVKSRYEECKRLGIKADKAMDNAYDEEILNLFKK